LTIYYQHIGEVMWARDAPRSIGTSSAGLIHFSFRDITGLSVPPAEPEKSKQALAKPESDSFGGLPILVPSPELV
jgi:hypothetical protein